MAVTSRAPTLAEARKTAGTDSVRRICGIHIQKDGQVAAVWLSWDKEQDRVVVYDEMVNSREVIAVQAEGLKRRGRWIPIAWPEQGKDIVDLLQEHGCNMTSEPSKDNEAIAEATVLDIWERMRTSRFQVRENLTRWLDEYKSFQRTEGAVPLETHPLMNATRHAIAMLDWARAKSSQSKDNYPRISII